MRTSIHITARSYFGGDGYYSFMPSLDSAPPEWYGTYDSSGGGTIEITSNSAADAVTWTSSFAQAELQGDITVIAGNVVKALQERQVTGRLATNSYPFRIEATYAGTRGAEVLYNITAKPTWPTNVP